MRGLSLFNAQRRREGIAGKKVMPEFRIAPGSLVRGSVHYPLTHHCCQQLPPLAAKPLLPSVTDPVSWKRS